MSYVAELLTTGSNLNHLNSMVIASNLTSICCVFKEKIVKNEYYEMEEREKYGKGLCRQYFKLPSVYGDMFDKKENHLMNEISMYFL